MQNFRSNYQVLIVSFQLEEFVLCCSSHVQLSVLSVSLFWTKSWDFLYIFNMILNYYVKRYWNRYSSKLIQVSAKRSGCSTYVPSRNSDQKRLTFSANVHSVQFFNQFLLQAYSQSCRVFLILLYIRRICWMIITNFTTWS